MGHRYKKRRRIMMLMLFSFLLVACSGDRDKETSPIKSAEPVDNSVTYQNQDIRENTDSNIMDFNKKLNYKKPKMPINQEPYIMFIGNGITYLNNLPIMFEKLSQSGGYQPDVAQITEEKHSLALFADPDDEMGMNVKDQLTAYNWDYVILQENTASVIKNTAEEMYPAAKTLDKMITKAGGETVFFMSWALKEGTAGSTREEMQTQMVQTYETIAEKLDAIISPVGIAFMRALNQYPEIELWGKDGNTPSKAGTYLSACTFYAVIYQDSPVGLSYIAGLDPDTAKKMQQIAENTVLG